MENKINVFKNIDTTQLKSIGETENIVNKETNSINIDKEFNATNQHTKQTGNFEDNKPNNENEENNENSNSDFSESKVKNSLGKILPAKIALQLTDKVVPTVLVLALYYMNLKIEKKQLQLTKDEINELVPAVQDCLDAIKIDMNNPFTTLGVMLGIVYGSKIIEAIPTITKAEKKKKVGESLNERLDSIVDIDEIKTTNQEKFEADFAALVKEIQTKRNRGYKDAKGYLAETFPEKIKRLGEKYSVDVSEHLSFRHVFPSQTKEYIKERNKNKEKPFDFPKQ